MLVAIISVMRQNPISTKVLQWDSMRVITHTNCYDRRPSRPSSCCRLCAVGDRGERGTASPPDGRPHRPPPPRPRHVLAVPLVQDRAPSPTALECQRQARPAALRGAPERMRRVRPAALRPREPGAGRGQALWRVLRPAPGPPDPATCRCFW
jgi:hypothetical protein